MNFLGFGQSADIDIVFDGAETRKLAEVKTEDGKKEKYLLYYDGETVSGRVNVTLKKPGSKLEHHGIKIELIGQIELYYDRGNHYEFQSLVRELARPGDLLQNTGYPFEFANVEKPYEVYVGSNVRLRYFLRVTIVRRISDIVREVEMAVHTLCSYPEMNSPIKMEVGIEDCLHIEFEYNKSKYHLKDGIVGKIYFLLVRIKIKHMEIAIIKRETTGSGPNIFTENETIAKYEIMDGAPVKGESIPIRVFLAGYDLTPTMRDINKRFSVRYFLNLVLMDTEDRRYFKQQEITLWRKAEQSRKSTITTSNNPDVPSHLVGADGEIMQKHTAGVMPQRYFPGSGHIDGDEDDYEDDDTGAGGIGNPNPRQQHRQHGGVKSAGGPADTEGLHDPTIGLFTQESPQQESKSPAIGSDHKTEKIAATATTAAALQQSFVDVDIQRGSGDGASAQPIEVVSEDIESSLFDDLQPKQAASPSSQTKTAPPSSKANLSTDVTAEDSTPPLMSVVSEI